MWNAVFLSLWFLSLPLMTAAAATNKNLVAHSTARLENRAPPKIGSAAPHLVRPSPNFIKPFNRPGGYYSLGGSQRLRSVPLPSASTSSTPLVRPQPNGVRPSYGGSEHSSSQGVRQRRQLAVQSKVRFSARPFRFRSRQR
jgi:hypothetical protein